MDFAPMPTLTTPRLRLRAWRAEDLTEFARLNADPVVMEFFPDTMSREESDAMAARIQARFVEDGLGLWAVEAPGVAPFLGYVGLAVPRFPVPPVPAFMPSVEIGWRLAAEHWGRGYASEAARAALEYGFGTVGLGEIVSFTAVPNLRSRRVMERIGMRPDAPGDFDHPALPEGHRLRRHVLYRLSADDFPSGT